MKHKLIKIVLLPVIYATIPGACHKAPVDADTIEISQREMAIDAKGGSFSIDVTSSTEFTISNNASWLQLSPQQTSYTSCTLGFTVQPNEDIMDRETLVIFKSPQVSDTLYVIQYAIEDVLYDEFMGHSIPGYYTQKFGNFEYEDLVSQYSITLPSAEGMSTHRILKTDPGRFVTISGLPADLSQGTEYTLSIVQNFTDMMSNRYTRAFTVEKIEGPIVWIYDHEYRQGAIITNDPTNL